MCIFSRKCAISLLHASHRDKMCIQCCFFQHRTVITHENVPENCKCLMQPTHRRPEKRLQREWLFKTNTRNNGHEPMCKDTQSPISKLFYVSLRLNCKEPIYGLQMLCTWGWDTPRSSSADAQSLEVVVGSCCGSSESRGCGTPTSVSGSCWPKMRWC